MKKGVSKAWGGIKKGASKLWGGMKKIFSKSPFKTTKQAWSTSFKTLKNGLTSLKNWSKGIWDSMTQKAKGYWMKTKEWLKNSKLGKAWGWLKEKMGFGNAKKNAENDPRVEAVKSATKQAQASSPAAIMSRNSQSSQINNNQKIAINIKPTKGMNEEKIADLVVQKVQEQNETNLRGSFNDYDEVMV